MEQSETLPIVNPLNLRNSMKKTMFALFAALAVTAVSAQDLKLTSAPGSNWVSLTANPSVIKDAQDDNNLLLQGRAEQGLIVGSVGPFKVNTYAAIGYSADKKGLDYNNKLQPALGVKLQAKGFDVGVQLVHERRWRGENRSDTGVQFFVNHWMGWDLKQ